MALAVATEGRREILGLRAGDGGEGAEHWKTALNAFDITFDSRLPAARQ